MPVGPGDGSAANAEDRQERYKRNGGPNNITHHLRFCDVERQNDKRSHNRRHNKEERGNGAARIRVAAARSGIVAADPSEDISYAQERQGQRSEEWAEMIVQNGIWIIAEVPDKVRNVQFGGDYVFLRT